MTGADHAQNRHGMHTKALRGLLQCIFAACDALALLIDGDAAMVAEGAHSRLRPAVLAPRGLAKPVEKRSDRPIRQLARQRTDQIIDIGRGAPAVKTGSVLSDGKLGMIAALPMQGEPDLVFLHAHDDLAQHGADDPLACDGGGVGMTPCLDQVGAHGEHGSALFVIETFRLQTVERVKFALALVNNRERRVPAPFEFGRHEPVGRVDCVVLSLRVRGLIAACSNASSICRRFSPTCTA